jgi:phosphate transport system permease protein
LQAVPRSLREASLALGASRIETIFKITFPAASSGVIAGVMLGVGRAIGETMTVMMVAGGSAQLALNPLSPRCAL